MDGIAKRLHEKLTRYNWRLRERTKRELAKPTFGKSMPKIPNLPRALCDHLFERLREKKDHCGRS